MTTTTLLAEYRLTRRGRFLVTLLSALILALCLSACGQADPICGRYLCVGAEADGLAVPAALLGEDPAVLCLTADGRGTLQRGEIEGSLSWTREGERLSLSLGGVLYDAAVADGQILLPLEPALTLRFVREELAESSQNAETMDWYGWWSIENSRGEMPDSWRDCCARLESGSFGPVLTLWDEDSSYETPLGVIYLRWDGAEAVTESGWLLTEQVGEGLWRLDPTAKLWELSGSSQGESERFDFCFHLRPWGARWTEEDGRLPFRYDDWYLPLIEAKASMPGQIGP